MERLVHPAQHAAHLDQKQLRDDRAAVRQVADLVGRVAVAVVGAQKRQLLGPIAHGADPGRPRPRIPEEQEMPHALAQVLGLECEHVRRAVLQEHAIIERLLIIMQESPVFDDGPTRLRNLLAVLVRCVVRLVLSEELRAKV